MLKETQLLQEKEAERKKRQVPKELPWYQRASQDIWFDEMQIPWYRDCHIGPMPLSPGKDGAEGKWVWVGHTVKRAEEKGRRILPVTARDVRS